MAFLDNSGDIILDAVLTDTGRFRLAKGDGSFKIVKFALSDDEINYRLYDKNNPSGSAYYDLEILQTPILEAFTNNASTMNYKLLSIPRTNLLYLPILKINSDGISEKINPQNNGYAVAVTDTTWLGGATSQPDSPNQRGAPGVWDGDTMVNSSNHVRIDQGIDNSAIGWRNLIDRDLLELQYIVEMDIRLGTITSPGNTDIGDGGSLASDATVSFVDDDNIASYYLSEGTDPKFVQKIHNQSLLGYSQTLTNNVPSSLVIQGAQGTSLNFQIRSSLELITSDYLFEQIGGSWAAGTDDVTIGDWGFRPGFDYVYIDTIVKITGATTGYKLDIPIRFVKCTTCI